MQVSIQFQRRMSFTELHVQLDYKLDESYTPSKLSVRLGSSYQDLKEVKVGKAGGAGGREDSKANNARFDVPMSHEAANTLLSPSPHCGTSLE